MAISKQQLAKLKLYLQNPDLMGFFEAQRQSDSLSHIADFITKFKGQDGYTPVKGKDYFTPAEIESFISHVIDAATPIKGVHYRDGIDGKNGIQGERGPIGEPGKTPVRGVDYWTQSDIRMIVAEVLRLATPQKGIHYFDGKDAKSAELTAEAIVQLLLSLKNDSKLKDLILRYLPPMQAGVISPIETPIKAGTNVTISKDGTGARIINASASASVAVDAISTTGGSQIITLTHTPVTVITVDLHGSVLYETTDYTLVGTTLTLTNTGLPAGLTGKIVYTY